jgi:L-rhamnose isomerase
VVILNDDMRSIAEEIVRNDALDRTHIALDFFDASMNRVGAWIIGTRATLKCFLYALLQPVEKLRGFEEAKDFFSRLALLEEMKSLPFGAIWDYYCLKMDVPPSDVWMEDIKRYESEVLSTRIESK